MPRFSRSNPSTNEFFNGKHRFEHWYRDNTVYFITSLLDNHYHTLGYLKHARDLGEIMRSRRAALVVQAFQPALCRAHIAHHRPRG